MSPLAVQLVFLSSDLVASQMPPLTNADDQVVR